MSTVNTTGIDRAALLAALYDRAQPQGTGFLHFNPAPMTLEEAQQLLDENTQEWPRNSGKQVCYFDYLKGRVMKIDVLREELDPRLYDRDNGQGAVQGVVNQLMEKLTAPTQ